MLADLGHILKASNLGAELHIEAVPMSSYHLNNLHEPLIQQCVLAGGDDYELCFTAPTSKRDEIESLSQQQNIALTRIAITRMAIDVEELQAMYQNKPLSLIKQGFDHFA